MAVIVLDANAVIMHGRDFATRVKGRENREDDLILPKAVKEELVDDVLANEYAPENHRQSAHAINELIEEEWLAVRGPDFERYGDIVDEARRRIADESLPEHAVKADQYIPALICELANEDSVTLITADKKLRRVVTEICERHGLADRASVQDPLTVL